MKKPRMSPLIEGHPPRSVSKGDSDFKIAKGAPLLVLGVSLLFLNARTGWMDGPSIGLPMKSC